MLHHLTARDNNIALIKLGFAAFIALIKFHINTPLYQQNASAKTKISLC